MKHYNLLMEFNMKTVMHIFVRNLCRFTTAFVFIFFVNAVYAAPKQMSFSSPEEAMTVLVASVKDDDTKKLMQILGPSAKPLVHSGDAVEDKSNRERFVKSYEEANKLEKFGETKMILTIGKDEWQFPIPLIKEAKGWRFDTQAGKEEILNRRVGRNELFGIDALVAYVQAHGQSNELAVYMDNKKNAKSHPYYGYFYRILNNKGSEKSSGYALVAWPATYGNTGVMTFIVNQEGVVYEKDLGPQTTKQAKKITTFNPDKTWKAVTKQ